MATFREIAHGSAAYTAACKLRDGVLRQPLGLKLDIVDFEQEKACRHFGLFEEGSHEEPASPAGESPKLVAVLMVTPREEVAPGTVQIRQLAVAPDRQGSGLGRQLMRATEAELARSGVRHIYLNAREPVIDFYTRLGYATVGPPHVEIGIPHQRMEKALVS